MSDSTQISKIFNYGDYEVRSVIIDGKPWFVAKDVCLVLDIGNVTNAIRPLDEDEKLPFTIERAGQKRLVNVISESGVYALVFKSKKPEAKQFRRWVTNEVLPEIRETGAYTSRSMTSAELILQQAQELVQHERKLAEHDEKIGELDNRVATLEGGKVSPGYMTVKRFASKHGIPLPKAFASSVGKKASAICKRRGVDKEFQEDENYDKVGAYPEDVLREAFSF